MVVGVLGALFHRNATGEGQYVDVAMLDGSIALNAIAGAAYFSMGHLPKREGEFLNGGTFYDIYTTKDGKYISVGGLEPKFLAGFLKALGLSDLAKPGATMYSMSNIPEGKVKVREALAQKTLAEWNGIFPAYDCCVEPVLDLEEMSTHPQTAAREMVVDVPDDRGGMARQIAHPIKYSATEPEYLHAGKPSGAETDEILKELGIPDTEAAALREKKVFG
jgi:crotonobetainyl-CoA:carnitine CoA-transferase CaiB-like acyl-CoA transferase